MDIIMKRFRSAIGVGMLVVVAVTAAFGLWRMNEEMRKPPSVIIVGGESIDFGKIILSRSVSRDLVIRNPHPYEEQISGIETGCACTRAYFSRDRIKPYGTEMLTLTETPDEVGPVFAGVVFDVAYRNRSIEERILISATAVKRK